MNSNLFINKRASNHSFSNYLIKHFKIAAPDTWKAIDDRLLHPVKYAVVSARVKFHSDSWKLEDVSSIGCKFSAKDDKVREEKPAEKFTKAETIEDCTTLLKIEGSLWDPITVSVNTHSFTNYMLMCLFDENIDAYEMIVGKAYGLAFVPRDKSIMIYRRDNRPPEELKEADGFQIKEALNPPDGRKDKYGAVYTDSSGISFALTPPSGHFGVNLYTVILPAKRKIPLINIADSPRNKDHPERSKLHEVNSLRPIPFGFFWSCAMTFHTWMNMEFSRDPDLGTQNIKRRGCF